MLNYIIKSENSQILNTNSDLKNNLTINNSHVKQLTIEKLFLGNKKSPIKNKLGIVNFTIEKKYKNRDQKYLSNCSNKKEENKELIKSNNELNHTENDSNYSEDKTEIKNTNNSVLETKELIANLDPIIEQRIYDNKENLISKLKQKSKYSNFKRLGLNKNLLEINNKASYDSNKSNNSSEVKNQSSAVTRNNNRRENQNATNKNISCDEIFYEYLKSITKYANQKYFIFVFKFIVIFRECINTYKNIELENSILVLKENIPLEIKEFTQYYDAEQAPELCNEFISEYLQSCDYFGFEKNEIPEIIDIIQHFCYWMYENNYTSSRLSLLNMN